MNNDHDKPVSRKYIGAASPVTTNQTALTAAESGSIPPGTISSFDFEPVTEHDELWGTGPNGTYAWRNQADGFFE